MISAHPELMKINVLKIWAWGKALAGLGSGWLAVAVALWGRLWLGLAGWLGSWGLAWQLTPGTGGWPGAWLAGPGRASGLGWGGATLIVISNGRAHPLASNRARIGPELCKYMDLGSILIEFDRFSSRMG